MLRWKDKCTNAEADTESLGMGESIFNPGKMRNQFTLGHVKTDSTPLRKDYDFTMYAVSHQLKAGCED